MRKLVLTVAVYLDGAEPAGRLRDRIKAGVETVLGRPVATVHAEVLPVPTADGCPADCANTDHGTCPRCYAATGIGCNHGPLCADCAAEQEPAWSPGDYTPI